MPTTEQKPAIALTEEERGVIDLLATEREMHTRNQSKIAALLRNLLTRTAEPNAVVLPVEVVQTLRNYAIDYGEKLVLDDVLAETIEAAESALLLTKKENHAKTD